MLATLHPQRGLTMVELMIGIVLVALLFALGAPSFTTWIQGTQIRTAAEAVQNGLMLARAEAVRRNTLVRFQLTDTLDNNCVLSTTGINWVISRDDPSGACASAIPDPSDANPDPPAIIQTRAGAEGSTNAQVSTPQDTVIFNGLGRVTPVPAGDINFSITNPVGGSCATQGGPMHCLRINVSTSGQIRMCDPMYLSTDPKGCPPCPSCTF